MRWLLFAAQKVVRLRETTFLMVDAMLAFQHQP